MRLSFLGGAQVVTGANYLIELANKKILVDCGLFQGSQELAELNYQPFAFNPKEIDYVFITHSHLDHCGRLPKLVRDGFKGKIICTPPTKDLMAVALADAVHLLSEESLRHGQKPLYEEKDLQKMLGLIKTYGYDEQVELDKNNKFRLKDAGHILGSSIIELWLTEKNKTQKLVFSGDLGNPPTPLLQPTATIDSADYLIIESAYGDRNHESRKERRAQLQQVIIDVIKRKAVLMIPSFAIERTQELLSELNELSENKKIPRVPIFIDSPLAIKITEVYKKHQKYFNQRTRYIIRSGDDIFNFPGLEFTMSRQESMDIFHVPPPKIIIAGSGMSTGGRILFHEKEYLSNPNNCFLVIGYQVEGTLGRQIYNHTPVVSILGQRVRNRAQIKAIGGYSAHADQKQLLNFISTIKKKVKKIFIVQGEYKPAKALKDNIEAKFRLPAHIPKLEEQIEL